MKNNIFKNMVLREIPEAEFINNILISPLPKIKINGIFREGNDIIMLAISKFSYSSVIESMKNPKIVIML
jgi:hypothetical protein